VEGLSAENVEGSLIEIVDEPSAELMVLSEDVEGADDDMLSDTVDGSISESVDCAVNAVPDELKYATLDISVLSTENDKLVGEAMTAEDASEEPTIEGLYRPDVSMNVEESGKYVLSDTEKLVADDVSEMPSAEELEDSTEEEDVSIGGEAGDAVLSNAEG